MMWSALNTTPSLEGKSRELRLLFAEVANTSLSKGRTEDEAIFKGLAAVKNKQKQEVKKYVKPPVPKHLQALLDLKHIPKPFQEELQQLEKANQAEGSLDAGKEIVGVEFDSNGRLTLKFKDGKKITSNAAPITAIEQSVVVVENGTGGGGTTPIDTGVDGGSATSVFKNIELIDGGTA